jgi:hypothetical protein
MTTARITKTKKGVTKHWVDAALIMFARESVLSSKEAHNVPRIRPETTETGKAKIHRAVFTYFNLMAPLPFPSVKLIDISPHVSIFSCRCTMAIPTNFLRRKSLP